MKNKIFLWEIILYFLLGVTFYFLSLILNIFYFLIGLAAVLAGFTVSLFAAKDKKINRLTNAGIGLFVVLVCLWLVRAIINSDLIFEDLILIFSQAVFYLIIILSFNYKYKRYSAYLQVFSLVVFLFTPLFAQTNSWGYRGLSFFYLFLWIMLIKAELPGQKQKNLFSFKTTVITGIVFFLLAVFLSFFLSRQPLFSLPEQESGYLETVKFPAPDRLGQLEKELYEKGIELELESAAQKRQFLAHLSPLLFSQDLHALDRDELLGKIGELLFLIKESGEKEEELDDIIALFEEYAGLKRQVKKRDLRNLFIGEMLKSPAVSLRNKVGSFRGINKLSQSQSIEEFKQETKRLEKIVPDFSSGQAEGLGAILQEMKEWQAYSLYKDGQEKLEKYLKGLQEKEKKGWGLERQKSEMERFFKQTKEEISWDLTGLEQTLKRSQLEAGLKNNLEEKTGSLKEALEDLSQAGAQIDKAKSSQDLEEAGRQINRKGDNLKKKLEEIGGQIGTAVQPDSLKKDLGEKIKNIKNNLEEGLRQLNEITKSGLRDDLFLNKMDAERVLNRLKNQIKEEIDNLEREIDDSGLDWQEKEALRQKTGSLKKALEDLSQAGAQIDKAKSSQDLEEAGRQINRKGDNLKKKLEETESQIKQTVESDNLKEELGKYLERMAESLAGEMNNLRDIVKSDLTDFLSLPQELAKKAARQWEKEVREKVDDFENKIRDSYLDWDNKENFYQQAYRLEDSLTEMIKEIKEGLEKADSLAQKRQISQKAQAKEKDLQTDIAQIEAGLESEIRDQDLKEELKAEIESLKQISNKGLKRFQEAIEGQAREKEEIGALADALEKIKEVLDAQQLNRIDKEIREAKTKGQQEKQAWQQLKDLIQSRAELVFSKISGEMEKKELDSSLLNRLKEHMQAIISSHNYNQVLESAREVEKMANQYRDLIREAKDMNWHKSGQARLEMAQRKKKENVEKALEKEGALTQERLKQVSESLKEFGSSAGEINLNQKELETEIKKMKEQGLINQESKQEALSQLDDFAKIAEAKNILENLFPRESKDYQDDIDQLSQMLENLNIQDKEKENQLAKMKEKLASSDSLTELEMIKKELEELISEVSSQRHLAREAEAIKKSIEEISQQRKNTLHSEKLVLLMEDLNFLKQNITEEGLQENIEELINQIENRYLERKGLDQSLTAKLEELAEAISKSPMKAEEDLPGEGGPGSGFIVFPNQLVMARGRKKQLNGLGSHQEQFLVNLNSQIHWEVEDASVAKVDQEGFVHALGSGKTKIYAVYNQQKRVIEITVGEPL